jgi:hypothetical protein
MQASWRTRVVTSPAPWCALLKSLRRSQYTWRRLGCDAGCPHSIQNIIWSHPAGISRYLQIIKACVRAYEILWWHQ